MRFKDRREAAERLAQRLGDYRGRNPLVLGIPRGAVPMAAHIADALEGDLDVVLVHKISSPLSAELAMGSVSERGDVCLNDAARSWGVPETYLQAEIASQLQVLERRRALYTPVHEPIDPAGRITLVVDNGVATGATMIAALRAVRARGPSELIAALAVAPAETVTRVRAEADQVVVLEEPPDFFAVGQFFSDFSQVSDADVVALLAEARPRAAPKG